MSERDCTTCQYDPIPADNEPCYSCSRFPDYSNYTRINADLDQQIAELEAENERLKADISKLKEILEGKIKSLRKTKAYLNEELDLREQAEAALAAVRLELDCIKQEHVCADCEEAHRKKFLCLRRHGSEEKPEKHDRYYCHVGYNYHGIELGRSYLPITYRGNWETACKILEWYSMPESEES